MEFHSILILEFVSSLFHINLIPFWKKKSIENIENLV
jgi:hypothetical protein